MAIPTIPQILTPADWNSKKGVFAKMFGKKTGIGEQLTQLGTLYAAVNWKKFDANECTRGVKSVAAVEQGLVAAKAEFSAKVEPVRRKLSEINALCGKVASDFKANAKIPSSSREHVEKIGKAADQLMVALKSMDAEFKAFEAKKAEMKMVEETMKKAVDNYLSNRIPTGIRELTAKPDVAKWESFHKESVRGLAAAVAANAKTKHLANTWKEMSSDSWKAVKNGEEIKSKLKLIQTAATEVQSAMR